MKVWIVFLILDGINFAVPVKEVTFKSKRSCERYLQQKRNATIKGKEYIDQFQYCQEVMK